MPLVGELFFSRLGLATGLLQILLGGAYINAQYQKEIRRIYPEQKRGSHLRLNFYCMGFGQTDLSWIEQERGVDKCQKKAGFILGVIQRFCDKFKKKNEFCQRVPYPKSLQKRS